MTNGGVRVAVALLVCVTIVGPALAAPTAAGPDPHRTNAERVRVGTEPALVATRSTPHNETNRTDTHHKDPDTVGKSGSAADVTSWLGGRMADLLRGSALQLSQRQYELASGLLGDEYRNKLGKYVDVAGETETTTDDERAEAYRRTRRLQRTYANTTQRYRSTLEAYREARANGNTERARELARELNRAATRLENVFQRLQHSYNRLGNLTGRSFGETVTRLATITRNATTTARNVRQDLFVATRLHVRPVDRTISYVDPAVLIGRISVAGNASLPDRITLTVRGEQHRVAVGANGSFRLRYRPRTIPTGNRSLRVVYEPENASKYLGTNTTVNVSVRGVTPSIQLTSIPTRIGYGDRVRVTGRVVVNGTPVTNTRVVVQLGGSVLGTVRTTGSGRFSLAVSLPAAVDAGNRTLMVTTGRDGRAVQRRVVTRSVQVQETATDLSVAVNQDGAVLRVSGQLRTANGTPIAGQVVAVVLKNTTVATVQTGNDGRYAATVPVPQRLVGETVTLSVRFDGTGTNLKSAAARDTVTVQAVNTANGTVGGSDGEGDNGPGGINGDGDTGLGGIDGSINISGQSIPVILLVAGIVGFVGLVGVVYYLRRGEETIAEDEKTTVDESTAPAATSDKARSESLSERFKQAAQAVDDDPDRTVVETYAEVRDALTERLSTADNATHWEFYETIASQASDVADPLQQLTAVYEEAAFAPSEIAPEHAHDALAAAKTIADAVDDDGEGADTMAADGGTERERTDAKE